MSRLVVSIGHVEFTSGREVLYVVKVQQDDDEWEVRRTYSDFRRLRDDVQRIMKDASANILDDVCSRRFARGLQDLIFPSKRLFGSKRDHVVKERAVELYRFLIKLLLLTHTYRKAQKTRYEYCMQSLPDHQKEAFALLQERTQASIRIFYLLRDFLKPMTLPTNVVALSGNLLESGITTAGTERDHLPTRGIRESKILAMRSSSASDEKDPRESNKPMRERRDKTQMCEQEHHIVDEKDRGDYQTHEFATTAAKSRRDPSFQTQCNSSTRPKDQQKRRHPSSFKRLARASTFALIASSTASSARDEAKPKRKNVVAASATVSTTVSLKDTRLVHLSSQCATNEDARRLSCEHDTSALVHSLHSKSSFSRTKRRATSAKTVQLSDSERKSRVTLALNAQAISIHAQRELEQYVTEYSAIMILRYVDRFINKAVMKASGCYRVDASNRLVIDGQRFLHELEETFTDLPTNFGDIFRVESFGNHEEWDFPPALDKYVQLKWDSFQQATRSSHLSCDNGHSSAADQTSDSESSDTEYEYEAVGGGRGGYMTSKQHFSTDEESMLQEMIANGTAGREQMLRLRRQTYEQGWNRRRNPSSRSHRAIEEASSSDSEDETRLQQRVRRPSKRQEAMRSVSCNVEKYQQEQNARRKDRLSRGGSRSIGGFV